MMLQRLLLTFSIVLSITTLTMRCEQLENDLFVEEVAGGCHLISGLTKSQRRVCMKAPSSTAVALNGMKMAIKECQHQMRWHRWNCSSLESKQHNPHSSAMLQRGYRESAFVFAITAAGVAHAIARACSQGLLLACSCDPSNYRLSTHQLQDENTLLTPQDKIVTQHATYQWKWGGCSHNIEYGVILSKMFLDSREKAGDLQSNVNLHNNEAGRLAVANNMELKCKCHGTSGSCQLKTCWRAVPDFRVVGKQLKSKFRNALMVGQSNVNNAPPQVTRPKNRPHRRSSKKRQWGSSKKQRWRQMAQPPESLLYYESSPSFCERNEQLDVWGTSGRRCARARPASAQGSCSTLCCGRGHDLLRIRSARHCRCRFHWCCRVDCDTCVQEDWVAVCK